MKDVLLIGVFAVGGFLVWKNWDKIAGRSTASQGPSIAPPTVPGDACTSTVSGVGYTLATQSQDPRAQGVGTAAMVLAPTACSVLKSAGKAAASVGKGVAKGASSVAKSPITKQVALGVATGGAYTAYSGGKKAVKKIKSWF